MADPVVSPELLKALGDWRTETLVIVGLLMLAGLVVYLGSQYLARRADVIAKRESEEVKQVRADKFTGTMSELVRAVQGQIVSSTRVEAAVVELTTAVKTQMATTRGVINPADSRRIIESEMWALAKECSRAYQVSLRENHYFGREQAIQDKMKRSCARLFDRSYKKLKSFDMAIKPEHFFSFASGDGLRYDVVDRLWVQMEGMYRTPVKYTDARAGEERNELIYDTTMAVMRDEIMRGHKRADQTYSTSEQAMQIYSSSDHASQIIEMPSDEDSSENLGGPA